MNTTDTVKTIGRAEEVTFLEIGIAKVHARIDTGAQTSAIWASHVAVEDGRLKVVFLGPEHHSFTGEAHYFDDYTRAMVASSNGHAEARFKIKLLVQIGAKKIRATFTLADRSTQVYPVLIGRNILRGKFLVDVKRGKSLTAVEKARSEALQAQLKESEEE